MCRTSIRVALAVLPVVALGLSCQATAWAALTPVFEYYPRFDYGTAYAYAEFTCHQRHAATLNVSVQDATKVWLNGRLVFEDRSHRPHKELEECTVPVTIRQGRNTVLVKVSKIPGEFQFALDFALPADDPAQLTWWR